MMKLLVKVFILVSLISLFLCGDGRFPSANYRYIEVSGSTFSDLDMMFHLNKVTTSDSDDCTEYSIALGGRRNLSRAYKLRPEIIEDTYKIMIPVNKSPEGACGWVIAGGLIYFDSKSIFRVSDYAHGAFSEIDMYCKNGSQGFIFCDYSKEVDNRSLKYPHGGSMIPRVNNDTGTFTLNFLDAR